MPVTVEDVLCLVRDVIAKMRSDGIDQWDEVYPDGNSIVNDLQNNFARWLITGGRLVAYASVDQCGSPEYTQVKWRYTGDKIHYVHRLMVAPGYQGQGLGKRLMVNIEDEAVRNGTECIRLDVFANNNAANNLYSHLRYIQCGKVNFRKGEFNCYEKILLTSH